jgi:O-antigen/teichoic acid export membrane protein
MMNLKNKLYIFINDKVVLEIGIVFIGTSLAGLITLLYHLVSVRLLSPEDYGTLNALISLTAFASMAIFPLTTTLTRFFTEYLTKKDFDLMTSIFFKCLKGLILFAFILFLLFVIFARVLGSFLNTSPVYIVVCGIIIFLTLISPPFLSLIQSSQKFRLFSFIIFSSSLTKLAIGFFLMLLGLSVLGGLLGFIAGSVLSLSLLLISITYFFKNHKRDREEHDKISKVDLLPIYKYFLPVSLSMASFTILTNIDLILVKHFFSALDTGYYSLAQMVGKILLFLPSAVSVVLFPKSIQSYVHHAQDYKLLYKSLWIAGLLCGGISTFCFLFSDFVLKILTSQYNPVSSHLVGLFSLAMTFYALLWIVMNFLLATHKLKFIPPLIIFTFLETLAISLYPTSLMGILWIVFLGSILTFATTLLIGLRN